MSTKISRRQFLKGAAIAGVGMALPLKFGVGSAQAFYQSPGLQMWQTTLRGVGPGQIPVVAADALPAPVTGVPHATIEINEFTDQLHTALGPTKLWGFNPINPLGGGVQPQKHLGGIIVVNRGTPLQITFRNNLPSTNIIPVDTTIPGANAAKNRTAVHLHGGLVPWISDGGPFDWWAKNGTHGLSFLNNVVLNPGAALNEAEYYYGNNQSARLVWYHDHAFGITRINAYAGIASAYIIRDTAEINMKNQGLPEFIENSVLGNTPIRELPIVIQDKIFVDNTTIIADPTWPGPKDLGSLWYPHLYEKNRWKLVGAGARLPNPSVIAEMFGDTMLVNGTVFPTVPVDANRYRLRILNACNARFLNLQMWVSDGSPEGVTVVNGAALNTTPGPDWLVIGNEAGFLSKPVLISPPTTPFGFDNNTGAPTGTLLTGNAERWDVIVDFTNFAGQEIVLYNDAPAPFPFGDDRNDYYFGNILNPVGPATRGYGPNSRILMKFVVGAKIGQDASLAITDLNGDWTSDPGIDPLLASIDGAGAYTLLGTNTIKTKRTLTLNESFDVYGRLVQMIGTGTAKSAGKFGRAYLDPPTETPKNGDIELWEIYNLTGDTHPIHFHLVNVQVLNRQVFTGLFPNVGLGALRGPDPTELGWKETVKMNPGEVIRVLMKFELPQITKADGVTTVNTPPSPRTGGNEYVVHCHILEHEEHDMMRPLVVT